MSTSNTKLRPPSLATFASIVVFAVAILAPTTASASQTGTTTQAGESSPTSAQSTHAATPPALGTVFSDPSGDTAILIGAPGASPDDVMAGATVGATPDTTCGSGYVCAYENYDYDTSNYSYAFPERYTPYQDLAGDCYSLDYGDTFNDCTKSDYNSYGSCSHAVFYWNANYGGNTYSQSDGTGTAMLVANVNQFSSQINCD